MFGNTQSLKGPTSQPQKDNKVLHLYKLALYHNPASRKRNFRGSLPSKAHNNFQAIDSQTKETVAIKKVFQDKRYKNREHQIIQDINHPNCVKLRDQYFTQGKNVFYLRFQEDEVYLNLVMNYIPETLYSLIKKYNKKKEQIPPQLGKYFLFLVKLYAYQMFRSLAYIDGIGVCHRDIKPSNVLVDP